MPPVRTGIDAFSATYRISSSPPRGTIRSMASRIFSSSPRRARSVFSTICTASAGRPAPPTGPLAPPLEPVGKRPHVEPLPYRVRQERDLSHVGGDPLQPLAGEEQAVQHRLREARPPAGPRVAGGGGPAPRA